jgi:hypothetical protein
VRTEVCSERNGSAEAEQHTQSIHGDVDDGDAELVDERRGQEVHQGEEPPHADEERVVDNRVCAVCCAVDVVGHEGGNEDGADELCMLEMLLDMYSGRHTCQARRPMESTRDTILTVCDVVCDVWCARCRVVRRGCQASGEMWREVVEGDFSDDDVLRGVRLAIYCVSGSSGFAPDGAASSHAERTTGQHYVRDPDALPPRRRPIQCAERSGWVGAYLERCRSLL